MTTYNDLCHTCKLANDDLNSHRDNGARTVTRMLREALTALGGPERWWQFDHEYTVDRAMRTIVPGISMDHRTGDILCRILLRFFTEGRSSPAELHIPIRATALDNGGIRFRLYEGEKIEADAVFTPPDEAKFREALYQAIDGAFAAFRPPGHRFA